MSLEATSLRNGTVFKASDGQPYRVTKYQHRTQGRMSAHINLRAVNLVTGAARNFTLSANDRVDEAEIDRKRVQYLYQDDVSAYFMDIVSFEQVSLPLSLLDDCRGFLKDSMEVGVLYFEGRPVGIELPTSEVYTISQTEPGVKGDRVSGAMKPATIESGAVIKVPLFVKVGDVVRVDTRVGEYLSKA